MSGSEEGKILKLKKNRCVLSIRDWSLQHIELVRFHE
jgi:hypothetical protein